MIGVDKKHIGMLGTACFVTAAALFGAGGFLSGYGYGRMVCENLHGLTSFPASAGLLWGVPCFLVAALCLAAGTCLKLAARRHGKREVSKEAYLEEVCRRTADQIGGHA